MTDPESTNACPTSQTTDIQPELPETQLGHVIGACSEDDGVPDIGVSIGLGEGSMLWLGELLKRDGSDIGFVFHGPHGKRIVAPIWPSCEWQDVADLLRHHVAPILARLTSTTPTLGDMVDREAALQACRDARAHAEKHYGVAEGVGADMAMRRIAALTAAPASPIPTSANEGERKRIVRWIDKALERADKHGSTEGLWLFAKQWRVVRAALSPALDNTAVEGQREAAMREKAAKVADDARCEVIGIPSAAQDMAAKAIAAAIRALPLSPALDNTAVEGARRAAFHAIYGKQADPFALPESYEYASEVADAVLAATVQTEKAR